jgi:hypothetical protein
MLEWWSVEGRLCVAYDLHHASPSFRKTESYCSPFWIASAMSDMVMAVVHFSLRSLVVVVVAVSV